jgi:hypothetical protein
MLTRLVRNAPRRCTSVDQRNLGWSKPQQQHRLQWADGRLVCQDTTTRAQLQRPFRDAGAPSNRADVRRISPWSAEPVRQALRVNPVAAAGADAERRGRPRIGARNRDESRGETHKAPRQLEPVAGCHDHNAAPNGRPRYQHGCCYLAGTLCIGALGVTVALRLYLRAQTVRRLKRHRRPEQQLALRSKNRFAPSIRHDRQPLLPKAGTV